MADIAIISPEVAPTPEDYTLPGAQEIMLRAVGCTVNGANADGTFLPALQMLDPSGHVMWTSVNRSTPVAAGRSALVSWFPGGGVDSGAASTTGLVTVSDGTTSVASVSELDFTSGAVVTAGGSSVANVAITAGSVGFSGARIYRSTNQSIPDTTDTVVVFDTVRYDVGGYSNIGTHPSRLTAPVTGYYLVGGCAAFPNGHYYTQIVVLLNNDFVSGQIAAMVTNAPTAGTNPDLIVNTIWHANAGDFFELDVVQESGAAANCLSAPPTCPEFWITLVGV